MIINSIAARNFRSFVELEETRIGKLSTIVGQNDVGKSNILRAIKLFFDQRSKLEISDVNDKAVSSDSVVIEVSLAELPEEIELEDGVPTTFSDENLLDQNGLLRIRKIFSCNNLAKYTVEIAVNDFDDSSFSKLVAKKEKELNDLCKNNAIDVSKSGRGVTNAGKRKSLRQLAIDRNMPLAGLTIELDSKSELWKKISKYFPDFSLFETDTKLGIGETTFQSQFRPIIKNVVENKSIERIKKQFTDSITNSLQEEVNKVFDKLKNHTDAFDNLIALPDFLWDKLVTFDILGQDTQGTKNSLENRGSGMRRLLMVAFFQYLAEREASENQNSFIFGVEEPENCLHPGLQREIVKSFRILADRGYQVIMTSHSPVFVGASPIDDLALIIRNGGVAKAIQTPNLNLSDIAEELGVEPADQITGYKACVFVEGPDDILFWTTIGEKFKVSGKIQLNFDEAKIGFIMCGGESLKHWIDMRAIERLNKNFAVVVDSDKKHDSHNIPGRKLNWKTKVEQSGGTFHILRKREIENYLHADAIQRARKIKKDYDDFSDMKELFGDKIIKIIPEMSTEEILEMDSYEENGSVNHELLEISELILAMSK